MSKEQEPIRTVTVLRICLGRIGLSGTTPDRFSVARLCAMPRLTPSWPRLSTMDGSDVATDDLPIPRSYDLPACVRCAACGRVVELTWTSSCEGYGIYCGSCWTEKHH